MPTDSLPDRPDIEQLKANAKGLRDLARSGADGAIELVREHHPRRADLTAGTSDATNFKLADAQLTVARHYGHDSWLALARLLLEAGAEANDSQTVYNRGLGDIASDDTEFLELLLDFGLGRGDGGPWRRRLVHEHQSPTEIVGDLLQHAAEASLVDRTRLLLARGVDPNGRGTHPSYEGRSPYESAVLFGNLEIADLLAAAGADTGDGDPLTRFIGRCLAGDRAAVNATLTTDPDIVQRARVERGDLVARATELSRPDSVLLLVDLGFDVNARHRTTALHEAARRGDLPMVTVLVELGADPTVVDESYDSTPSGWAEHSGQTEVVEYFDALDQT